MNETELQKLVIRFTGDASSYVKSAQEVSAKSIETGKVVEDVTERIKLLGGGLQSFTKVALGALTSFGLAASLGGAFSAFEKYETGQMRLQGTLEANGRAVGALTQEYQKFAAEQAKVTTLTKGGVMQLLQQAETFGATGAQAERVTKNSIALAAALGGEAAHYVRIAKAIEEGNTPALRRIPALRGIKDETELLAKANAILAAGEKIVEKQTETAGFRLEKLGQSLKGVTREMGALVADGIKPVIGGLEEAFKWFNSLDPTTRKVASGTTALILSLTSLTLILPIVIAQLKAATLAVASFAYSLATPAIATVALVAAFLYFRSGISEEIDELNKQNERLKESLDKQISLFRGYTQKIMEEVKSTPERSSGRKKAVEDQLTDAKKQVEAYNKLIDSEQKKVDQAGTGFLPTVGRFILPSVATAERAPLEQYLKLLKEARDRVTQLESEQKKLNVDRAASPENVKHTQELIDKLKLEGTTMGMTSHQREIYKLSLKGASPLQLAYAAALDLANNVAKKFVGEEKHRLDGLEKLNESLEKQIATYGMSADAVRVYEQSLLGTKDAELKHAQTLSFVKKGLDDYLKILEKGRSVTEEVRTPEEKHADKLADLKKMLDANSISLTVYQRAVAQAEKELNKASGAATKFNATAFGSAEAISRLEAQRDVTLKSVAVLTQGEGVTTEKDKSKEIVQNTAQTVNILLKIGETLKDKALTLIPNVPLD